MKKLWFVPVLLLALAAQGCIIVSDDDDPGPPTSGAFHTTWSITAGNPATASTCAAQGADKVAFLSTQVGTTQGFDDQFPCADLAGDTGTLAIGDYTISVDVLNAAGTPLNPAPANLQDGFNNGCDSVDANNVCIVNLPNIEFNFTLQ